MIAGERISGVDRHVTVTAEQRSVLQAEEEPSVFLANVTLRRFRCRVESNTDMFVGELVGRVHSSVALGTERCLIRTAHDRGEILLTYVTLYPHLDSLWIRSHRFSGTAVEWTKRNQRDQKQYPNIDRRLHKHAISNWWQCLRTHGPDPQTTRILSHRHQIPCCL